MCIRDRSTAVLLLFLILILRLIVVAERQQSPFGRVYGYYVLSIFLFHLFINIDVDKRQILKHNNACGRASRPTVLEAWNDALAGGT